MGTILCVVAVIAFGAPFWALFLRKNAPIALFLHRRVYAARRKARGTALAEGFVLLLRSMAPDILLPGQSPSHEAKCFSVGQGEMSMPI